MLRCWYELVNGLQNSDWLYLPVLSGQEVNKWLETRLTQYPLLYRVMNEYVFFACAGLRFDISRENNPTVSGDLSGRTMACGMENQTDSS
ncbi:hypothetical protein LB105_003869 [Salmonella enterica]|uniref:Uncharacterized protein n=1 Tax=Salmonella enterica subsp. enterica serovar Rough O:d:1,7 TaxID=1974323 RepID=A0A974QCU2_SALET|nr:hypothetical protein [Salmonella enterica]EBW8396196.1 hypothetical protein [Salmonella enterica subsp. enterica serovar Florida]ECC9940564.1 hypothetical protein [Salmonella enterica subsp. enterica]EAS1838973.1 hypothetical protein [Salmonella enterica]EBG9727190.1 hypothetical protein [Salmonella enterica]ECD7245313.1 hypothetical protein [Salmonella enterica subsp. enterica serovar Florida]